MTFLTFIFNHCNFPSMGKNLPFRKEKCKKIGFAYMQLKLMQIVL